MAAPKVVLNSSGVLELLSDPGVAAFLHEVAEGVADAARAAAPHVTGEYHDSIDVVDVNTGRAVARVVATAPHAHLVEARTGNLAKAMSATGGGR